MDENEWSPPITLFEGEDALYEPFVTADASGGVHIFWAAHPDSESDDGGKDQLIFYTYWNGDSWSTPVDIAISQNANAPSATVDRHGTIHLLWHGFLDQLYYSRARVGVATSARAWSEPLIVDFAQPRAHVVVGSDGVIHVVYAGRADSGLYYQSSSDGGAIWSSVTMISLPSRSDTAADYASLAIDEGRNLHVVWSEFELPGGWPPVGVFYSRSSDGGNSWSDFTKLAGEGFVEGNIAVDGDNHVHVAWNGIAQIRGRYHRWSEDGGNTWSEPARMTPDLEGGLEGPPQMVVDSAGTLHLLTSYGPCAWYLVWEEQQWSKPVCISGDVEGDDPYIEEPALAVSQGNTLHAVFWDERTRLWYASKPTQARAVPLLSLPTLEPQLAGSASGSQLQQPVPHSEAISRVTFGQPGPASNTTDLNLLLFQALGPVVVIIGSIVLFQGLKRGR